MTVSRWMEKLGVYIDQAWFWFVLPHKIVKSSRFLLWTLCDLQLFPLIFHLDPGQAIGRVAALFSASETSWVFSAVRLGWLSCWNAFHLHHPGRWQHRFLPGMSQCIFPFIPPSVLWGLPVQVCWKNSRHHVVRTSKLHCCFGVFVGDVHSDVHTSPNMLCIMTSKELSFTLIWPDSPSISQAYPNVVQQILNKLRHALSSAMESCRWVCIQAIASHQLGLNQLISICTDKEQDRPLITDWFQLVSWLSTPFCTSLSTLFPCVISHC